MGLTFDAEKHEYRLDGRVLPSVTTVIKEAGLMGDTSWYTEGGRTRGSYVAQMIRYHEEGTLDVVALEPELQQYLSQYIAFKNESGFKPTTYEQAVHDPVYQFAGTLDLLGLMPSAQVGRVQTLIDVKLGADCAWHSIQLFAYRRCVRMRPPMVAIECANLYLRPDGWKLVPRKDTNDEKVFLAALGVVNWKRNHGL